MLSYRHAFHAGNHADVLKHAILVQVLEYMVRKDRPFLYVDTHAGSGLYDLRGDWAEKNREYETGIGRIPPDLSGVPEGMHAYLRIVQALNPQGGLSEYPGSPWIARVILRAQDKARLFELHPNEYQRLHGLFSADRNIKTEQCDGFQALSAVLPPAERRAVIFIDPPYEVKSDYRTVVESVKAAYRKFTSGVYLIWYPSLNRTLTSKLESDFVKSGMRNILLAELSLGSEAGNIGMTTSGMIIVNPPWQLSNSLQRVLPFLQKELAGKDGGYRLQQLVAE
jgi:23S rRNA (adenine2030-N6)-methyltransferase